MFRYRNYAHQAAISPLCLSSLIGGDSKSIIMKIAINQHILIKLKKIVIMVKFPWFRLIEQIPISFDISICRI